MIKLAQGERALNRLLSLPELICEMINVYGMDPADINGGWCAKFAEEVQEEAIKHGIKVELTDDQQLGHDNYTHTFMYFDGFFYDSESPDGVENWQDLPIFIRQAGNVVWWEYWFEALKVGYEVYNKRGGSHAENYSDDGVQPARADRD